MNNLFYFNITYKCNNNCKSCCSFNTRGKSKRFVTADDIKSIAEKFNCTDSDVFIISGGEPTLSEQFDDIVNYCMSKSKHIILYTNGRNTQNINADNFERIIVPLYGKESAHNSYVGNINAYAETIRTLKSIIENNPDKIELKLLINKLSDMKAFVTSDDWNVLRNNNRFSISRVIKPKTDVNDEVYQFAEDLIVDLLAQGKMVKFYDLPFCKFGADFQKMVLERYDCHLNTQYKIICGSQYGRYTVFDFNKRADYNIDCANCNQSIFCTKIMQNYYCPVLTSEKCWIGTE